MTKEEAIKLIESCNGDVCGFSVNIISKEDICCNCNDETINRFNNLSDDSKEEVLSEIADNLKDIYEEYTFHQHFKDINFYDFF